MRMAKKKKRIDLKFTKAQTNGDRNLKYANPDKKHFTTKSLKNIFSNRKKNLKVEEISK